ncbi:nuclear transport factor 2 family protein [Flavobacterium microcysteis]
MRKLVLFVFFISLVSFVSFVSFKPLMGQEAEIRESIKTFFEGIHSRDSLKINSVSDEDLMLQTVVLSPRRNKLVVTKAADFKRYVATIPKETKFEEKLLSFTIKVDEEIAHAWIPFEFYINGELTHKGVNSIQLFKDKEKGIWKIIYYGDSKIKI